MSEILVLRRLMAARDAAWAKWRDGGSAWMSIPPYVPTEAGGGDTKTQFEYEYLFEPEPDDVISIDGWVPIATERIIGGTEKIAELLAKGKLRTIEKPMAGE